MPLYAYRCTQCGNRFEKIQKFSSKPIKECPKCHGLPERLLTAPRFRFKGSGWYVNDYAAKNESSASESGSGTSAPAAETNAPSTPKSESAGAPAAAAATSAAPSSGTTGSTS